ncbi:MAG TPA: hypothetical protein VKB86_15605 [Pyrinomonadaceae bacterium]|nr:hypothetical protein [Pyrinomonadaceae bacterium]
MSSTLDKIKEEVRALPPEELHEVRELVDSLLSEPAKPQMTEEEFARYLAAKGVISLPDDSSREEAEAEFDDYKPITVEGQPLSEMIIEDRR